MERKPSGVNTYRSGNSSRSTKRTKGGRNAHLILENESLGKEGRNFLRDVIKVKPILLLQKDKSHRTPFHVLAENNHEKELYILLRRLPGNNKAKYFWAKDGKGKNAMEIARPKLSDKIAAYKPSRLGDKTSVTKMQAIHIFFKR